MSQPSVSPASMIAATVALTGLAAPAVAQALTPAQAHQVIAPFYEMLNRPAGKDIKALAEQILSPQWKSYASETEYKGRDAFVSQVAGFGKLIPDLAWDIKEVMVDGNRIIVRSEASGTPTGPFFGVPVSGKSFRIMTIDIHTIENGKAVTAHHVEDWAGAIRQLTAK